MYINIAKRIENNQTGRIVLFLYPIPKLRTVLFRLYKNAGLNNCIDENKMIKIDIDTKVMLFCITFLNIYYSYKQKM